MRLLRTPDERFAGLPEWPHEPRYHDIADGIRVHYVEAGPAGGRPCSCSTASRAGAFSGGGSSRP